VPVFDTPATGRDGVAGVLGPVGAEMAIFVVDLSPLGVYSPDTKSCVVTPEHCGLVIVCKVACSGLRPLNADRFRQPDGTPAIHISSAAKEVVLAAIAPGRAGRLCCSSQGVTTVLR
jgi:hypothetical protein